MAAAEGQGEVASRPAEPPAEPGAMGPANHRREDRSRSPHRIVQYLQKDEEFLDGLIVARRYVADLQKFLKIQKSIIEFQEQTFKQMDVTLEIALLAKKESEPWGKKVDTLLLRCAVERSCPCPHSRYGEILVKKLFY